MEGTNVLKEKVNSYRGHIESQKFEDIVEIFLTDLYKPVLKVDSYGSAKEFGIKGESYTLNTKIPKNKNFKKFMQINQRLIYKYANNIKKNYKNKLLDAENEYANIYLYILESLYYFYKNYCNEDINLFKEYIRDSNKTYVNSEGKEYTFSKYMYMSLDRRIKEENKIHEESIEKGNINLNGKFSRLDLDNTKQYEDGSESDILDLHKVGAFTELNEDDIKSDEEILEDNIEEMLRIQSKLLTVLTKSQMQFMMVQTFGCYYDIQINDFVIQEYSKQQKNQYFNQISKRVGRDIKPFYVKHQQEKYIEEMIKHRRINKKVIQATPRDTRDYIGKYPDYFVSNIKIER